MVHVFSYIIWLQLPIGQEMPKIYGKTFAGEPLTTCSSLRAICF